MEQLILVDESNRAAGSGEKDAVHRAGLLHRAFSIFIVDGAGRILLQRTQPPEISLRRAVGEFLLRTSAAGRADAYGRAPPSARGARHHSAAVVRLPQPLPRRARRRHAGERVRLRLFRTAGRRARTPIPRRSRRSNSRAPTRSGAGSRASRTPSPTGCGIISKHHFADIVRLAKRASRNASVTAGGTRRKPAAIDARR